MRLVPGSISKPINVIEYEEYAKEYLPKNAYDYYSSGADDMHSLRENRAAFARLTLRPRVLRDVSHIDIRCSVLGHQIETSVCVSPTAMQCMAHPLGEVASARAAAKTKNCFILSSLSTTSLEVFIVTLM
jgi:isopentenyl diphosphate isomerase/L-lactate dehydrogenase-like FMN-dependent dehydrogenase